MRPNEAVAIRTYRPGDEVGILECYNAIFPDPERGIRPRSLAHWRWKFTDNPTGLLTNVIGVNAEGKVVGSYPCMPMRIWAEGREQLAAQGVDLMVLPDWRRAGKPPGLFAQMGWKYNSLYCGSTDGKILFTYGLPVPAWRSGQRYLGFMNICNWDLTYREFEVGGYRPRATPGELETRPIDRYGADVDGLFASLRGGIGLALVRDARYLNWRYADCPDRDYALFECRERASGALRGIAVYTRGEFMRPNTSFLVDWLCAADDDDATVSMVTALEDRAAADGTGALVCVWNHSDPRFLAFQRLGYMVRGTPYFMVLASFKYETTFFRDGWLMTMGDCDLI